MQRAAGIDRTVTSTAKVKVKSSGIGATIGPMRFSLNHGFIISSLLLACVTACGPKENADTDTDATAATTDTTTAGTATATATDLSSSVTDPATGTTGTPPATGTEPGTADPTSDTCGGGGCNPAPVCGEPCICCCSCRAGEGSCTEIDGGPAVLRCADDGSCFAPEPCGADETCVSDGQSASCSGPVAGCGAIEAEYDGLLADPANKSCGDVSDCKTIDGHCGVGLGGCSYAVAQDFDESQLDALALQYTDQMCTQGVCDCAEAPPLTCTDGLCAF